MLNIQHIAKHLLYWVLSILIVPTIGGKVSRFPQVHFTSDNPNHFVGPWRHVYKKESY